MANSMRADRMADGADSEHAPSPSKGILKVDINGKGKSAAVLEGSGMWDRRDNIENYSPFATRSRGPFEIGSTSSSTESSPELYPLQIQFPTAAVQPLDSQNFLDLSSTAQAIHILTFLKQHLSTPFHRPRFATPDISVIHTRDPAIVSLSREWMPYLEFLEPDGLPRVIDPLYRFFQSGQVLCWIEVMATAKQLRIALETASALRRWADSARTIIETEHPQLLPRLSYIHAWAKDLAFLIIQFGPCLKAHPNEIYYITPSFLPRGSLVRAELETLRFEREKKSILNFFEREEWEPYKFVKVPRAVTSDPDFVSSNMARFTFNSKGSLIAYRGTNQVVVYAAYTSAVIASFGFPKRRIAAATFVPRSPHLSVLLTNGDSQLVDLRNGITMAENPDSSSSSQSGGISSASSVYTSSARGSFATTCLEERAFAVGPEGVVASFSIDGVFRVTRGQGPALFTRKLQMDIPEKLNKKRNSKAKGLTTFKKQSDSTSDLSLAAISEKVQPKEDEVPKEVSAGEKEIQFRCYDISTVASESIVMDRLIQQCPARNEKSIESACDITFNSSGMATILHTTNAFGANLDVLHIIKHSTQQLQLVYSLPPQPLGGFAVSTEGDIIALMPAHRRTISIIRLAHGIELYKIDPPQHSLSPIVGFTFIPGNGNIVMTAHAANHTVYWDINRLSTPSSNRLSSPLNPHSKGTDHSISSAGNRILFKPSEDPSAPPVLLHIDPKNHLFQIPIKRPLFNRCRSTHCPLLISEDGASALIGQHLYTFTPKSDIRFLSIPKNSRIVRAAIWGSSTTAFASLQPNLTSVVRIHNWNKSRGSQDWCPGADVLNIWGLAFDEEAEVLAVGTQLKSTGLDRFTGFLLTRGKGGKVEIKARMEDWESLAPISLSFRGDKLIVLARGESTSPTSSPYSVLTFPLTSEKGGVLTPHVQNIAVDASTPPHLTNGELFYLGSDRNDGWLIRHQFETEDDEKRVAFIPLSWRRLGTLRIVVGVQDGEACIVCFHRIFGSAVVKSRVLC